MSKQTQSPIATGEVRELTDRLGWVSAWRRDRYQSDEARLAMRQVDANAIQNSARVAISAQDTATAVTMAAINAAGVQAMTTVHIELVTNINAGAEVLDDVAIATGLRSGQRALEIEADLLRRRDAGEITAELCASLIRKAQGADERRRQLGFDATDAAIEDLTIMGREARRGARAGEG